MAWIPYTNRVEVCNAALAQLALLPIGDFEADTTREATLARHYWKVVVGQCHAANAWHFARKSVLLTLLQEPPVSNKRYSYLLPDDFVSRVIGLWPARQEHDRLLDKDIFVADKNASVDYEVIRQNVLCTDDPRGAGGNKMLEYVSITEPNFWPSNFARYVINELTIVFAAIGKQDEKAMYLSKREDFFQNAILEDSSQTGYNKNITFDDAFHMPYELR